MRSPQLFLPYDLFNYESVKKYVRYSNVVINLVGQEHNSRYDKLFYFVVFFFFFFTLFILHFILALNTTQHSTATHLLHFTSGVATTHWMM